MGTLPRVNVGKCQLRMTCVEQSARAKASKLEWRKPLRDFEESPRPPFSLAGALGHDASRHVGNPAPRAAVPTAHWGTSEPRGEKGRTLPSTPVRPNFLPFSASRDAPEYSEYCPCIT